VRGVLAAVALSCALGIACATKQLIDTECSPRPEVASYLQALHDDLLRHWTEQSDDPGAGSALVAFTLTADGTPKDVEVTGSDERLTREAEAAFAAAQPFQPLTGPLECLVDAKLRAAFGQPNTSVTEPTRLEPPAGR
jgi:hypothetical protein